MDTAPLSADQREYLRHLAALAVSAAVLGEPAPDPEAVASEQGIPLSGRLAEPAGAFVTLTRGGALRGCIGSIVGTEPLVRTVTANGRNAAVGDPRFAPVGPDEVPGLDLEISVLTPLRKVSGPSEIEVGRHGVLLSRSGQRAVFLPQVAVEQGWDRDAMLTNLALKAGLDPDAWRHGAVFEVFEAEVF